MAVAFRLPDIGEGVHEAEIVRWLVREGEQVEENQPVLEVQTDKAVVELPAPTGGTVTRLNWKAGETVSVGEVLYVIRQDSANKPSSSSLARKADKKRVLATPSTRRLAREYGVDLSLITGTGGHGQVTREDVLRFLEEKGGMEEHRILREATKTKEVIVQDLTPIRRVIGERLQYSVITKPHVTHFDELEADGLVQWYQKQKSYTGTDGKLPKLTYTAILAKLVAITLKHYPRINAHYDEEKQQIRKFASVSLGIATDTSRGLLVPVLRKVEQKNMNQLASEIHTLTELAREGELTPEQMRGSTFTISNAGALGGKWATPIIQPPEVAILALHPVEEKPIVQNGRIATGWRMNVSLSFDHRVLDGADAIRFTQTLGKYTKDPGLLLRELT